MWMRDMGQAQQCDRRQRPAERLPIHLADPGPFVLLLSLAILASWAPEAGATEVFAKREDVDCVTCHLNPAGGGPRNLVGLYYGATGELREDRETAAAEAEMDQVVDAWLWDVAHTPPEIIWRYVPLDQVEEASPPAYSPVDDTELLRRLSLDLRSNLPEPEEVAALEAGETSIDALIEEILDSEDFYWTMRLYHRDLVRPRTGIFNKAASLSGLREIQLADGGVAYSNSRVRLESEQGQCRPEVLVDVAPYWDRDTTVKVCLLSARDQRFPGAGDSIDCATEQGQRSGMCGCGPHLSWCYRSSDYDLVKKSMWQEGARIADEVLRNDLPYTELVTADWSMWNGRLEHFYARLDGRLGELSDPDANREWHRVERGPEHSGILSTHMYLNYFYNGRRWAQRTFETFLCHETVPDFELLDEFPVEKPVSYRTHPLAEADINVNSGRACAACHLQLDGLSRVKDRWDNFGQYYETRPGADPVPEAAIFLGEEVDGLDAFGKALARSEVFADCATNQLWEHLSGHRFEPSETALRRELVEGFIESGYDFRALVRTMVSTDAYRDAANLKTMERELYKRSLHDLLGVDWDVGGRNGFDRYYDKVGGMDYRKIEARDRSPSVGYSLVQYKAAAEMCADAIEDETGSLLAGTNPGQAPSDAELDNVLKQWFLRIYGRPADRVDPADLAVVHDVFRQVEAESGPREAYMATCAVLLASQDFAVY